MKTVGMVTKKKDVQLAVSRMESETALIHTQIIKQQLFSDIKTHQFFYETGISEFRLGLVHQC
jgi:hypothetical protein